MSSVTGLVYVSTGMLRLWTDRLVPKAVQMHQGSETTVAAALGRLRAEDERVAGDAEAALGSLTWDDGLQTFLWYELPRKWLTDLEGKLDIAASLGRLLELVGLPRYAAICRGPETAAADLDAAELAGEAAHDKKVVARTRQKVSDQPLQAGRD
jgi:hypothetical protein